jgi:ribonuclease BN (tRNA processing enzyme)
MARSLEIIILGSSAATPFPRTKKGQWADYLDIENYARKFSLHNDPICNSAKRNTKDRRTRSSIAVRAAGKTVLFDSGPDTLYQQKKWKIRPDAVFLSHAHQDASAGEKYMRKLGTPVYSERNKNIKIGKTIEIGNIKVTPFRVLHVRNIKTVGYWVTVKSPKSKAKSKIISIATDFTTLHGLEKIFKKSDIIFVDGSILKRNFRGHLAIESQLETYKKWQISKVYFTHIGHDTLPHQQLSAHVKKIYKNASVAFDGLKISL